MKKLLLVIIGMAFALSANASTISEGAVVKTINNPNVYIIKYKNGKQYKRLVLNPQVFESYGHLKWENILTINQNEIDSFIESTLVKVDGENNVYKLAANGDVGDKAFIESNYTYDLDSVYTINSVDFGNYLLKKIEELHGNIDELKKQTADVITETSTQIPSPAETWAELEIRNFAYADTKGWTTLISTNSLGEKRYYRKEGSLWVRKNNETEIQKPYVAPPTSEQLSRLRHMCLASSDLQSVCERPEFMPGYYSNLIFRNGIDEMVNQYHSFLSEQAKQKIDAENATLECIMAETPETEHLMDPATQNYLRQLRCGTVTETDRTNYELSRIKTSTDELKYRLDSKISFPSFYLDPIEAPTFTNPRWEIRWDGSGGTITDSSGNFYRFYCEFNTCKSY